MYFSTRFPRSDQAVLSKVKCSKKCLNSAISTSLCVIATQWFPRGPSFKKGCRISSRLREKVLSPFEETSPRKKRAKITVFLSLSVCGNWSKDLFLPIIMHIAVFPIVSKVRYAGNCPDSHRLNPEVHKNHNPFHTPCLSFE